MILISSRVPWLDETLKDQSDLIGWPKWAVCHNIGGKSCNDTSKGQPLEIAMATSLPHHDIATEVKNTVCGLLGNFMICLLLGKIRKSRGRC